MEDRKKIINGIVIVVTLMVITSMVGCLGTELEKEYEICILKGETTRIGEDSDYYLQLLEARSYTNEPDEAVIAIYIYYTSLSTDPFAQPLLKEDAEPVKIDKLTISLEEVDKREEYANVIVKETKGEIDVSPIISFFKKIFG